MNKLLTFLFLSSFLLTSCGDLFMQKKKSKKVTLRELVTCELNTEAFGDILTRDIKAEILCLQESLHLFMKIVKDEKPNRLNKIKLKKFLKDKPEIDRNIFDIIDAVYDLSYLIFGGNVDNISRDNVDKLVDFLIVFNKHIWKIQYYFQNKYREENAKIDYDTHMGERRIVFEEANHIAQHLLSIFIEQRPSGAEDFIDLNRFIDLFFKNGNQATYEKIKKLIFTKRIFLGESNKRITHLELKDLIYKAPTIVRVTLDLIRMNRFNFEYQQPEFLGLFKNDLKELKQVIYYDLNSKNYVAEIKDIIGVVNEFLPDFSIDFSRYPKELEQLKGKLFGGTGGHRIDADEIGVILDHAVYLLDKGRFFFSIYDEYRDQLSDFKPISYDIFRNYPTHNSLEESFRQDFARIASEYRFFKGSYSSPFYSNYFQRNPNGFFEIAMIEHLAKLLFKAYGQANPLARGGYHMTLEQTKSFMLEYKRFLVHQGIVQIGRKKGCDKPNTYDCHIDDLERGEEHINAANNLVLLSTLFQYQSDGCDNGKVCLEVPEITEFAISLFTSLDVQDFFIARMEERCPAVDNYGRISVACFRDNFMDVMNVPRSNGFSMRDYLPRLYVFLDQLKENNTDKFYDFFVQTEAFARTCTEYSNGQEVPMRKEDMMAIFAGILNIESTMLKFDKNNSNIMEHWEVMDAYYSTYQGAIKGMVKDMNSALVPLSKQIFQFLIKYREVPSGAAGITKFLRFLTRFNKKAPADRTTIAAILRIIGEQDASAQENAFVCDKLKQPWDQNLYP